MIATKTTTIENHETILRHLLSNRAIDSDSAITLHDMNFNHATLNEMLENDYIGRIRVQAEGRSRPPYAYWIEQTGKMYLGSIESSELFNPDCWAAYSNILKIYVKWGNEADYIRFAIEHLLDVGVLGDYCRELLYNNSHPAIVAVLVGLAKQGNMNNLPQNGNFNREGYAMRGGQLSSYAQEALDKLMTLYDVRDMNKSSKQKNTVSGMLEFCILYTCTHYDAIKTTLGNMNSD